MSLATEAEPLVKDSGSKYLPAIAMLIATVTFGRRINWSFLQSGIRQWAKNPA